MPGKSPAKRNVIVATARGVVVCVFRRAWMIAVLLPCGCYSPAHTRLPTFWTGYPQSEGMAYQQQDPFPDPDIGPDTQSRPLGFVQPRTQERRATEQRLFQGLPSTPESIPRGYPRGGMRRPQSVY